MARSRRPGQAANARPVALGHDNHWNPREPFFLALKTLRRESFQLLREVFADGTERPFIPHDGQGLNPLLQHPAMMIHPPVLYLGFVGFTIPFAFAMAALIERRLDSSWTASIRRWSLISWLFLGAGIVLGGYWAYLELGWGGYWAWDPVENASLFPWLTATAFLHSIVVQQRRGMLKGWNCALIVMTFLLCIFGTFLTRSGIVSSVHAFGKSSIGPFFAVFLCVAAILSFALMLSRRRDLKGDHRFDALLTRESSFLYNNFLFLLACVAVLGGTLFPVISEWFTGDQIAVGQQFYNRVFIPIGLLILLLMGVSPLLDWERTAPEALRRRLPIPLLAALAGLSIAWAMGARSLSTLLSLALTGFVTAATLLELCREIAARRKTQDESYPATIIRLFRLNRRRYGGYVVHLGWSPSPWA
jgi:cytochrome c-type biogenesis protein CcmF